jgi:hypothetical protein
VYSHRGITESQIGGALVRRAVPGKGWLGGAMLSRDDFLAIPVSNRMVLLDQGYFEIIIRDPAARRFVVEREDGLFDVVSGRLLNSEPLDKDAAAQLAADDRAISAAPEQPAEPSPPARAKRGRPFMTNAQKAAAAERRERGRERRHMTEQGAS